MRVGNRDGESYARGKFDKNEILELNTMGFLDRKENILFVGPSGVGKTHLAVALGITAAKKRYSVYFISCHDLITQLNKAHFENNMITYLSYLKEGLNF